MSTTTTLTVDGLALSAGAVLAGAEWGLGALVAVGLLAVLAYALAWGRDEPVDPPTDDPQPTHVRVLARDRSST